MTNGKSMVNRELFEVLYVPIFKEALKINTVFTFFHATVMGRIICKLQKVHASHFR